MTKKIPVSYLVLFLCNFIAVSLAIGGSGASGGNDIPGERRGSAGEGQERNDVINDTFENIQVYMQNVRREFCILCSVAVSHQEQISQLPENPGEIISSIKGKLVSDCLCSVSTFGDRKVLDRQNRFGLD